MTSSGIPYHIPVLEGVVNLTATARFYSDDKAGDHVNYIRERAAHANKPHIDVLYDVGDDVIAAQSRVDSVLSGQGYAEEAWQLLKSGLV
jgi:hypothetical protein